MSRQKAINEKCKSCIYDPHAGGTWRKQVEECTIIGCPLYEYRPGPVVRKKDRNSTDDNSVLQGDDNEH